MPQAKKSTASARGRSAGSARSRAAFKEPAALKRLNKALDDAQKALAELGKHGGRDVSAASRALNTDVRKFLTSARRDSGKLGTALKRDFEQAQKQLAQAAKSTRGRGSSAKKTTTRKKTTAARSSTSRSRRAAAR
jgi:DNA-binding protein HU-beta